MSSRYSQIVLVYSHHRMGKTSLVHQVLRRPSKTRPKVHAIYIDLYGTLDENDFIDAILTGLTQKESKMNGFCCEWPALR